MGVYVDQLAAVRKAIAAVLASGQNVSYQGRSLGMADLKTLRDLEREYEALAAGEMQEEAGAPRGRSRIINVTPLS